MKSGLEFVIMVAYDSFINWSTTAMRIALWEMVIVMLETLP
jgi:hypothetical protein